MSATSTLARCPWPSLGVRGWADLEQATEQLNIGLPALLAAMLEAGFSDAWGSPTRKALRNEHSRWMENRQRYCWRLEDLAPLARQAQSANSPQKEQEGAHHAFASMQRVGQAFGCSTVRVGQELKRMGWRARNGVPTAYVLAKGIARMEVGPAGRVRVHWDLERTIKALEGRGWGKPAANPPTRTWGRPAKLL